MADRSIVLRLRAEISDLKSKMAEASKSTEDFGKRTQSAIEKNSASISTLANGAGLLGAAMVAAAGVAVLAFANFDESMSAVEAATHESAASMDDLRDAALKAGADTKFSATEAAGAIEELAKAGVSTTDILNGGLNGALDLAAAGGLDVAEAAGIAAVALQQFNLDGSDMSHVADLLAAGAGKAMGDVTDLGQALKQAGLVANSTGLTIEETTAGLSAFAAAGLLGSDAGTSFKSMLQRLTPQSAEAQAQFDTLGISAYDAQGNFVGLSNFAGQLQTAMKDLTPEARNAALSVMFGSDAVRAANVLYDEGAAGIDEWTVAVNDSGYAAETAGIMMNNLKGDWEQLTGSVETALIGLGEGANGPLRDLVQRATEMVNAFAGAPDAVQGTLLALVGGGGLVLLGVAGLGKLVTGINSAKLAMSSLGVTAKTATLLTAGIGGALAIATIGLTAWADANAAAEARVSSLRDSLDETTNQITANTREVIANDLAARKGWWIFKQDSVKDAAEKIGLSLETITDAITGNETALAEVTAATKAYALGTAESDAQLEASGLTASEYGSAQMIVRDQVEALTGALGESKTVQGAVNEAVGEGTEATEEATTALEVQIPTLQDLIDLQNEAAGVVLSERDAQRQLQAAIDDATAALETNGATLDITTEAGRANQDALDRITDSTWATITSMQASNATQGELQLQMAASREAFITTATAMGTGADEANRLADEMGLIPEKVGVTVSADISGAARDIEALKAILRSIPDVVITPEMRAGTTYYTNRAAGGYISGPGTSTSDSIPARLSNGEYVVKASAVSQYGVGFFDTLNAQRFATGGYVGASGGSSGGRSSLAGLAIEGTLDLGGGLVGVMRGVVKAELSDAGSRARYAGGS